MSICTSVASGNGTDSFLDTRSFTCLGNWVKSWSYLEKKLCAYILFKQHLPDPLHFPHTNVRDIMLEGCRCCGKGADTKTICNTNDNGKFDWRDPGVHSQRTTRVQKKTGRANRFNVRCLVTILSPFLVMSAYDTLEIHRLQTPWCVISLLVCKQYFCLFDLVVFDFVLPRTNLRIEGRCVLQGLPERCLCSLRNLLVDNRSVHRSASDLWVERLEDGR